jgi:hypothetical protein
MVAKNLKIPKKDVAQRHPSPSQNSAPKSEKFVKHNFVTDAEVGNKKKNTKKKLEK